MRRLADFRTLNRIISLTLWTQVVARAFCPFHTILDEWNHAKKKDGVHLLIHGSERNTNQRKIAQRTSWTEPAFDDFVLFVLQCKVADNDDDDPIRWYEYRICIRKCLSTKLCFNYSLTKNVLRNKSHIFNLIISVKLKTKYIQYNHCFFFNAKCDGITQLKCNCFFVDIPNKQWQFNRRHRVTHEPLPFLSKTA